MFLMSLGIVTDVPLSPGGNPGSDPLTILRSLDIFPRIPHLAALLDVSLS